MKVCVLMGSPRKNGNTAVLLEPFCQEMRLKGAEVETIWLHDKDIRPCMACRSCQKDWTGFGCAQKDDGQELFEKVFACDLLVLATPIYVWYCTPTMKALLDRMVYAMNKGEKRGPPCGRERRWHCWRPAAIRLKREVTFLRRGCAATASIPVSGTWEATWNTIWDTTRFSWMKTKRREAGPENY